jgi:hypothetical protein
MQTKSGWIKYGAEQSELHISSKHHHMYGQVKNDYVQDCCGFRAHATDARWLHPLFPVFWQMTWAYAVVTQK